MRGSTVKYVITWLVTMPPFIAAKELDMLYDPSFLNDCFGFHYCWTLFDWKLISSLKHRQRSGACVYGLGHNNFNLASVILIQYYNIQFINNWKSFFVLRQTAAGESSSPVHWSSHPFQSTDCIQPYDNQFWHLFVTLAENHMWINK